MAVNLKHRLDNLYDLVTGDEDTRVCKDIPEAACNDQPSNFFAYLFANLFNKIADELTSAKLILPWLLVSLGVPVSFAGFLVPIRETGVLLPQLFIAAMIRKMPLRKPVWLLGGFLSAMSLLGMVFIAIFLDGTAAGFAIIGLLIVFSLSRGLCSVSAKDVLGKTVSKTRRGRLMGYSAGIGGGFVLLSGLLIATLPIESSNGTIFTILLLVSVAMWGLALASFASIKEQPGATDGGGNAITVAIQGLACLRSDTQFRRFVIVRIMMLSIALAPPFYVLLAQKWLGQDISSLGLLIIASGVASSCSSPFWGMWGDHSSRWVMVIAATSSAVLGLLLTSLVWLESTLLSQAWVHIAAFMILIVMHCGVRLGRKVYLVDMATADNRAMYVAVSNTIIGIAMMIFGSIGLLTGSIGLAGIILLLSILSLLAAALSMRLEEA